jgi:hypothetical protein
VAVVVAAGVAVVAAGAGVVLAGADVAVADFTADARADDATEVAKEAGAATTVAGAG